MAIKMRCFDAILVIPKPTSMDAQLDSFECLSYPRKSIGALRLKLQDEDMD